MDRRSPRVGDESAATRRRSRRNESSFSRGCGVRLALRVAVVKRARAFSRHLARREVDGLRALPHLRPAEALVRQDVGADGYRPLQMLMSG